MRRKLLTIATMLLTVLLLGAASGFSMIVRTIRADVPFSFIVGHTKLPAGEYVFTTPEFDSNYTLLIRQVNGNRALMVQTVPVSSRQWVTPKTQLIFDKVGNDEFLRQVWEEGMQNGDQIRRSHMEREMLAQAGESHITHINVKPTGTQQHKG